MKHKINVAHLTVGMYVTELDRPWTETPFLFQGFTIESDDDLTQLRELCDHVYILGDAPQLAKEKPAQTDLAKANSPEPAKAATDPSAQFLDRIRETTKLRDRSCALVTSVLKSVASEKKPDLAQIQDIVSELIRANNSAQDASLWLTMMRNDQHDATAVHGFNTAVIAIALARLAKLPLKAMKSVGTAALLHDVGKAKTPASILYKAGPLSPQEFEIVRRHAADGYEALKSSEELPESTAEIIFSHHERLDGRGYPRGLSGTAINQEARIVMTAEVYDELTNERVYHEAMAPQQALALMRKQAKGHFGEDMLQYFLDCLGNHPVGSLIQLDNGAMGVVISHNKRRPTQPLVMLLRDQKGQPLSDRPIVNLALTNPTDKNSPSRILRALDAKKAGIDIAGEAKEMIEKSHHE
ncbi:MAG: HD-GYP domain-containing protein [Pseudomonadota bacterium]|nr:HD-GYP domain-containing protein [Pseudomonadota bacterium]